MQNFETHQNIIRVSEDKKAKKGEGIGSILVLMKELCEFQDKVDTCLQAQEIADIKAKIQQFDPMLDKMYQVLVDIAKGGMNAVRERNRGAEVQPQMAGAPSILGPGLGPV